MTNTGDQNKGANNAVVVNGGFASKIPVSRERKSDNSNDLRVTEAQSAYYNPILSLVVQPFAPTLSINAEYPRG